MKKTEQGEELIDTSSSVTKSDTTINGNFFNVLKVINTSNFTIDCDMANFTNY